MHLLPILLIHISCLFTSWQDRLSACCVPLGPMPARRVRDTSVVVVVWDLSPLTIHIYQNGILIPHVYHHVRDVGISFPLSHATVWGLTKHEYFYLHLDIRLSANFSMSLSRVNFLLLLCNVKQKKCEYSKTILQYVKQYDKITSLCHLETVMDELYLVL